MITAFKKHGGLRGPADAAVSVLRLGAAASVVQSALFVVIGIAALRLGVDRLVDGGFASLAVADPAAFRVLRGAPRA